MLLNLLSELLRCVNLVALLECYIKEHKGVDLGKNLSNAQAFV